MNKAVDAVMYDAVEELKVAEMRRTGSRRWPNMLWKERTTYYFFGKTDRHHPLNPRPDTAL